MILRCVIFSYRQLKNCKMHAYTGVLQSHCVNVEVWAMRLVRESTWLVQKN